MSEETEADFNNTGFYRTRLGLQTDQARLHLEYTAARFRNLHNARASMPELIRASGEYALAKARLNFLLFGKNRPR